MFVDKTKQMIAEKQNYLHHKQILYASNAVANSEVWINKTKVNTFT